MWTIFLKNWIFVLFLFLTILLSWKIWLGKTSFQIDAPTPFRATLTATNQIQGHSFWCSQTPCAFRISPGVYELTLESTGFFAESLPVKIFWQQKNFFHIPMRPIPVLQQISKKPESWQNDDFIRAQEPFFLSAEKNLVSSGNPNQILADFSFLETETVSLQYDASLEKVFLQTPKELYEVDIKKRRKYKILEQEQNILSKIKIISSNTIVLQESLETDKTQISLFFTEKREKILFPENTSPTNICQNAQNKDEFFYFISAEEFQLKKFIISNNTTVGIAGFPLENEIPQNIFCYDEHTIFIETSIGTLFRLSF